MKKKIISGAALAAIFITAIISFSVMLNEDSNSETTDMGGEGLPRIFFNIDEYQLNPLAGYMQDMDITTMRDTVFPLSVGTSADIKISRYSGKISSLTYEICTLDGEKILKKKTIDDVKETVKIEFGKTLEDDEEKVLKIKLVLDGEKEVYYYTRVVRAVNFNVQQCLDFAKEFHEKTMNPDEVHDLKKYLSKDIMKKNKSLQTVTLGSDISAVGWGDLKPEIISDVQWEIKESNGTYTSILLQYQVKCAGEKEDNVYNVNEFFKVRFLKGKASLEDYNRVMSQKFTGGKEAFDKNGILLGYASTEVPYLINKDGDNISFVQEREVWHYDSKKNEISQVFSFSNNEKDDMKNENDDHSVRLLDIENNGNTIFAVYGYMNRGKHEGQVGVAVYYYDVAKGNTNEVVFIPSTRSGVMTADHFGKMIYYNKDNNIVYAMIGGNLYKVHLETKKQEVLVKGLKEDQYTSSEDCKMLSYQSDGSLTESSRIEVWNLKSGKNYEVEVADDEVIRPLGFVGEDVIYGIGKKADIGKDISGETLMPFSRIEIQNDKNEVLKTYENENSYVVSVSIDKNMVNLQRVQKDGDYYVNIAPDYITNNKHKDKNTVHMEAYATELKGNEVRITYGKELDEKAPTIRSTNYTLPKGKSVLSFEEEKEKVPGYYVYGRGHFQGAFEKASDAVAYADELKGTVVTEKQALLWERGNRMLRYNISDISLSGKNQDESAFAACVRQVLQYENKNVNAAAEMAEGKSAMEILNDNLKGEAVDLSGCTMEQICYIINQGTPVIATTGGDSAVLITGYDDKVITYFNPDTGGTSSGDIETLQSVIASTQGKLIGYVK